MRRAETFLLAAVLLSLVGTTSQAQLSNPRVEPAQSPPSSPQRVFIQPSSAPAPELRAALEAVRARRLVQARELQASLPDPVARRIVDWALVDVFGEQLGARELLQLETELQGWPREETRRRAIERARGPSLPSGPVPYAALVGARAAAPAEGHRERRLRMNEALRNGDARAAYQAIAHHGMAPGSAEYAEAEAFAGWLALNKLRDPHTADRHFVRLDAAVKSPVSKARAAYWRGRTHDALGDAPGAQAFYEQGAQHTTTFYGQLAAERAGRTELVLAPDPIPTLAERSEFEAKELVRALRLLSRAGEKNLVRTFGLHLGERVESAAELALLVDAIKGLGEQELSLLAYRRGAQNGLILHERGYPVLTPPAVASGAEPSLVLAIVRQESQFDPQVRSSADARGMMQLLPGTGREMAQKTGLAWDEGMLWDADYNMRLGSRYLGHLTQHFGGSYIMAAAGYNAGPSRPRQWVQFCGDPRSPEVDPLDFIECIPFSETRTYVMNAMANLQVYRARLGGGRAPLTAAQELRHGGWARPAQLRTEAALSAGAGAR